MAVIFDGKRWAENEEEILKGQISELKESFGITPKLVSILVGDDPASRLYSSLKKKAAERVGAKFKIKHFKDPDINVLIHFIEKLNEDDKVHGIMIQLPLPASLEDQTSALINEITPEKDVDGLCEGSLFVPATVKAILEIIDILDPDKKTNIVVIGNRGMVGKPLVIELKKRDLKIIGCNSETKDLKNETLKADILISATGASNLIKGNMVKKRVSIIDVGAPKGDVDPSVRLKASFITPVPGGIGPMTISCLLANLLTATYNNLNSHICQSS